MSRYLSSTIGFIFLLGSLTAQTEFKDFNWKKAEKHTNIPEHLMKEDAVCIRNYRSISFSIVDLRSWRTKTSETVIRKVKIQTQIGLEDFSKVFLWKRDEDKIEVLDARSIKPNGKVVNLDASEIKQLDFNSEEHHSSVDQLRFAIPGVEVGDEVEMIYRVKSDQLRYSGEVYMHTNLPTLKSEVKMKFPNVLQLDVQTYNGMPNYSLEKGVESLTLKWHMNDLPSVHNDMYAQAWRELPYVAYVIRTLFTGTGGELQRHSLVKNSWSELYLAYHETYSDLKYQMRSGNSYFKDYLEGKISEAGTADKYEEFTYVLKSYLKDLNLTYMSQEEANNHVGHFLEKGQINRHNFHILLRRTFKYMDIKYGVCYARNKYQGKIDPSILAPGFISDVFYSIKDSSGKLHFIYPSEVGKKYNLDELPYYLYGSEAFLLKGKNFTANNVSVELVSINGRNMLENTWIRQYELELKPDIKQQFSFNERLQGIVAIDNQAELVNSYLEETRGELEGVSEPKLERSEEGFFHSYMIEETLAVKTLEENTYAISLADLIDHSRPVTISGVDRVLDYFPKYAYSDEVHYFFSSEREIEIINPEDLLFSFSNQTGGYRCKVELASDGILHVESIFIDSGIPLPAERYNELEEISQGMSKAKQADIIIRLL